MYCSLDFNRLRLSLKIHRENEEKNLFIQIKKHEKKSRHYYTWVALISLRPNEGFFFSFIFSWKYSANYWFLVINYFLLRQKKTIYCLWRYWNVSNCTFQYSCISQFWSGWVTTVRYFRCTRFLNMSGNTMYLRFDFYRNLQSWEEFVHLAYDLIWWLSDRSDYYCLRKSGPM